MEMNMDAEIEKMHKHIHDKRQPLNEMLKIFEQHGFTIEDVKHEQFNYHFADATAMFNHYFFRMAFIPSWVEILPENKVGQIFETIESRLNEKSKSSGGFKLSIPYVVIQAMKK